MSKLFNSEIIKPTLSLEEFMELHKVSSVISQEAFQDFFSIIKDVFSNNLDRLLSNDLSKEAIDATSNKYEVMNIIKRIHGHQLTDEIFTTPEKFKGQYVAYMKDLTDCSKSSLEDTKSLLVNLKMAVGGFINEYKEDNVLTIYGASFVKSSERLIESNYKTIKKYFPLDKAKSKSYVTDVIKRVGDIETIYNKVPELVQHNNLTNLQEVTKLSREVSDMVDSLIEMNTNTGILIRNNEAKKELIRFLEVGSRTVEQYGYMYANTLSLLNSIKSIGEAVARVGNR